MFLSFPFYFQHKCRQHVSFYFRVFVKSKRSSTADNVSFYSSPSFHFEHKCASVCFILPGWCDLYYCVYGELDLRVRVLIFIHTCFTTSLKAVYCKDGMVLQRGPQSATLFGFDSTSEAEVWDCNLLCCKTVHLFLQAFVSCSLNGETLGIQRASVVATSSDQVNV